MSSCLGDGFCLLSMGYPCFELVRLQLDGGGYGIRTRETFPFSELATHRDKPLCQPSVGRCYRIRTCDFSTPNGALYQTELNTVVHAKPNFDSYQYTRDLHPTRRIVLDDLRTRISTTIKTKFCRRLKRGITPRNIG